MCRRIFAVYNLEDFAGDFPGGFFWALFPTEMRRKNPATKSAKKSGGPKIKIREKSALPNPGPKKSQNLGSFSSATCLALDNGTATETCQQAPDIDAPTQRRMHKGCVTFFSFLSPSQDRSHCVPSDQYNLQNKIFRGLSVLVILGAKNWTQTFFSQTFRAIPGYPGKIPGYPAQKVWFPCFRGKYRTFWPPPLHVEDPYPTGKYPDSKV